LQAILEYPISFTLLFGLLNIVASLFKDKIDSCQHSESSEPNRRPFYNFLGVEDSEMTDKMRATNHGGREAGRLGIDLNLKL